MCQFAVLALVTCVIYEHLCTSAHTTTKTTADWLSSCEFSEAIKKPNLLRKRIIEIRALKEAAEMKLEAVQVESVAKVKAVEDKLRAVEEAHKAKFEAAQAELHAAETIYWVNLKVARDNLVAAQDAHNVSHRAIHAEHEAKLKSVAAVNKAREAELERIIAEKDDELEEKNAIIERLEILDRLTSVRGSFESLETNVFGRPLRDQRKKLMFYVLQGDAFDSKINDIALRLRLVWNITDLNDTRTIEMVAAAYEAEFDYLGSCIHRWCEFQIFDQCRNLELPYLETALQLQLPEMKIKRKHGNICLPFKKWSSISTIKIKRTFRSVSWKTPTTPMKFG